MVYPSGYQIWDITSLEHVYEIFSCRNSSCIKAVKFIPTPEITEEKGAPFYGQRPLVVAIKDDESDPNSSILAISSIKSSEKPSSISFKHKIQDVACNSHAICVVRKK